jgi:REP element-mobilizing transposase RayT
MSNLADVKSGTADRAPLSLHENGMKHDPTKHHRRSIRLKGYDYHNAGAYFVTICTKNRECVLDDPIVNGIINAVWQALLSWFPTIELDEFVVMPNHIHFILWITDPAVGMPLAGIQGAGEQDGGKLHPYEIPKPTKINFAPALGDVVGAFKSLVFKVYLNWIEANDPTRRAKFWQGNYYEHIIRNDVELNAIRQYIIDNPANWNRDRDDFEKQHRLPQPQTVEDYLKDINQSMLQMNAQD